MKYLRERQILYDFTYMSILKKKKKKTKGHKKIEAVIDTENEQVVASRERVLEERNR